MPVATETFNDDTLPAIGILISSSQCSRVRRRMPFAFRAHHQRHTARHFALIQSVIGFASGTHNPDILFLKQTHGTREVGHADQRHAFGCATGHFFAVALSCAERSRGTITA